MGFENTLATGIGEHLAASCGWSWKASGAYASTETGIVIDALPQDPANLVSLHIYTVDEPLEPDALMGCQIVMRNGSADPRKVNDMADRAFNALHGLTDATLAGLHISLAWRQSTASLGQDGNRRWSRSDNYYIRAHRRGGI